MGPCPSAGRTAPEALRETRAARHGEASWRDPPGGEKGFRWNVMGIDPPGQDRGEDFARQTCARGLRDRKGLPRLTASPTPGTPISRLARNATPIGRLAFPEWG